MWRIAGLISAAGAALVMWALVYLASQGLPQGSRTLVLWPAVTVAALVGFLAGGTTVRRAQTVPDQIGLFSALAGAVAGGVIGLVAAVGLTAAYLSSYATWPASVTDDVLLIIAYPAFGLTGFFVGAIAGVVCGALAGLVLRIVTPATR
jgi:hypothetical protein